MIDRKGEKRDLFIALGMFSLIVLWLLVSTTGTVRGELQRAGEFLPGWFVLANLVLAPLLLAMVGLRVPRITVVARLVLLVFGLISCSIASLAYKEHPFAFLAMLALIFLEAYWVIPKWNARDRARPR